MKSLLKISLFSLILTCGAATANAQSISSITYASSDPDMWEQLNLEAVACVFSDSRNMEDFEFRLNNSDGISNLDLNRDGYIDYLRVMEDYKQGLHVAVIQAVLGNNLFQDVATIVVNGRSAASARVQIIGSPYIYGANYVIEPVFTVRPVIFGVFWAPTYVYWRSPYHWGYYPPVYRVHPPVHRDVYVTHVHVYVRHDVHYRYEKAPSNARAVRRLSTSVSRNDYSRQHPERSFNSRNTNVRNSRELAVQRQSTQRNASQSTSLNTTPRREASQSTSKNNSRRPATDGRSSSSSSTPARSSSSTSSSRSRQSNASSTSTSTTQSRSSSNRDSKASTSSSRKSTSSTSSDSSTKSSRRSR